MPKQVTAWESIDGSLHRTEEEAQANDRDRETEAAEETLDRIRCGISGKGRFEGIAFLCLHSEAIARATLTLKSTGKWQSQMNALLAKAPQ